MSKKTFRIVTGTVAAITTAASTVMALFKADWIPIAIAIVGVVNGTTAEICSLFLKEE